MPDLVTLDYVKEVVGKDGFKNDNVWALLITAASAAFLTLCNRPFLAATQVSELYSGDGTDTLILRNAPVISVDALNIGGVPYGAYSSTTRWGFTLGDTPRSVVLMGSGFDRGFRNVAITYTAGYATVPSDVQQAVAEMVVWKKAKMPRIDLTTQTLQGQETVSYSQAKLPPSVMDIVANYTPMTCFRSR